ncbi:hypothetical protein GQX73_g1440 [Xylaria multiplex]|uniref:Uncharacterized protein n=1 Tax=Xylaria multiplex TaxID=323545 RepID=A0A7C8J6U6_9PEZI|nr:hypothetical protein GQX73_g1440 [Xylaria multiplex]
MRLELGPLLTLGATYIEPLLLHLPPQAPPPSNDQSNKRRKVSHNTAPQQNVDALVNQAAIQAAIAEEEKKVESALLKRAEELGDAHWVLDVPGRARSHAAPTPLNVIQVGFAQIDSSGGVGNETDSDESLHDSVPALRRFNMDRKKIPKNPKGNSSESSSDSESESDSESDTSSSEETSGRQSFSSNPRNTYTTQSTSRKILQSKKSAEQLKAMQFAEKRRKKEVKLNNPKGDAANLGTEP